MTPFLCATTVVLYRCYVFLCTLMFTFFLVIFYSFYVLRYFLWILWSDTNKDDDDDDDDECQCAAAAAASAS